jgi:type IV fimbrial biogenesis protein FimT
MRVPSQSRNVRATGAASRARGFTIVELMITVAVAAILLIIAVPSFRNIINSNRLTTATNTLVNALNTARMEAIKRNASVQFCSNSATNNTSDNLGTGCGTDGGAVVLQTTSTTTTQVLDSAQGLVAPVQLSGDITAIRFNSQGIGYEAGTSSAPFTGTVATLCVADLSSNNRIAIGMTTGTIIATTTTTSTGACP